MYIRCLWMTMVHVSAMEMEQVLVISRYEYDIVVITRVRGEAEDEC